MTEKTNQRIKEILQPIQDRGQYGRKLTDEQSKLVSEFYLEGYSISDLVRISGLGEKTIRNALERTKTPKRTKSEAHLLYYQTPSGKLKVHKQSKKIRKYEVNNNYFSKGLNNNSAYVLGFWLADGSIDPDRNLITFDQMEDGILNKIKEELNATYPIYTMKMGYRLSMSSNQMCSDIQKLCSNNFNISKTTSATYPHIKPELDSHFIRGVFDGDGCLTNISPTISPSILFTGTHDLIQSIQLKLIKNCDLNKVKITDRGNFVQLTYSGINQVIRICEWLYKDANICLERKYRLFLKIKEIKEGRTILECPECEKEYGNEGGIISHYRWKNNEGMKLSKKQKIELLQLPHNTMSVADVE